MDTTSLAQYGRQVAALIEATTTRDVDRALDRLMADNQWELLGRVLPTASEVGARRIVNCLLEQGQYEPLAWAACLRRQLREAVMGGGGRGGQPVFRDLDAEEGTAGVPEHIMADVEEMADAAARRAGAARQQASRVDRDAIRDLIVSQLAGRLPEAQAGETLLLITRACPFDATRRQAAMKLANHKRWLAQLGQAGRTADLLAISEAAKLKAVGEQVARILAEHLAELQATGDRAALAFVAECHPNNEVRQAARTALGEA